MELVVLDNGVMLVPVIYDSQLYSRTAPPTLGERVRFELFWNDPFARMWAGLQPGWSLTAALTATAAPPFTRLGETPEQNTEIQPATGTYGALRFRYRAPIPVPASVTISGALRVTAFDTPNRVPNTPLKGWSDTIDDDHVTTGTVQRIQLVSILIDLATTPHTGRTGLHPIAGTEWFYDLAQPPTQLHHYRPDRNYNEPEPRAGLSEPRRNELLLLDLNVDE